MVRVVKPRSLEDPRPTLKPVPPEPLPLQSSLIIIMKSNSNVKLSSNTRWIRKRELMIFMMLPVWLMGLRNIWKTCFLPLHNSIMRLWSTNGSLWLTQYLALVSRIIVLWVGGERYREIGSTVRVRLTRSGLPLILPSGLRKIFHLLRGGDHAYALLVIRVTLTLLSVYRVIGCTPIMKLDTITGLFSGTCATLPVWEVAQAVGLLPRALVIGPALWTYVSESAGPNFKKSTWSAGVDALAFLRDPLVWFHWLAIALHQKAWLLIFWNLFTIVCVSPLAPLLMMKGKFPRFLGRLVTLFEARGKVRIVAITDWWTQVLLKPLHSAIFDILRLIPQDGTFDQMAPIHILIPYIRASGAKVFSFDLSAATDRLPVAFQMEVLRSLGVDWAVHWAGLLVARPWYLKGDAKFYAVGQPMGALSSWAMLALSHHLIVQISARRVGYQEWFQHYALLGDDIVIADAAVAGAYLDLMRTLGVPINASKSFEMLSGTCEFAKRWIHPLFGDLSPISPGLILGSVRNPRMLATLFSDSLSRGFVFPTRVVRDLNRYLVILRPRKWLDKHLTPILSSVFGPTSGLWETASGLFFRASWIGLYPHSMAKRVDDIVDALHELIADHQEAPPSEEVLKEQLVANFWLRAALFGSDF